MPRTRKRNCKAGHEPGMRLVPEIDLHCRIGRCIVCGEWFSLGPSDEPQVDVSAAWLIAHLACGEPRGTNSEQSGMAGELRFYGTTGWDAGWLASAWAQHDALQREEDPATGAEVVAAGQAAGLTIEDAVAVFEANGRQVDDGDDIGELLGAVSDREQGTGDLIAVDLVCGAEPEHGVEFEVEPMVDAIEPHPDTLAQPFRSWPPNTGCERDAIVKIVIDPVGGTTYCDGADLDTALRDNAEAVRDLAAMIKPGDS